MKTFRCKTCNTYWHYPDAATVAAVMCWDCRGKGRMAKLSLWDRLIIAKQDAYRRFGVVESRT